MDRSIAGLALGLMSLGALAPGLATAADARATTGVAAVEELRVVAPRVAEFDAARFDADRMTHGQADVAKLLSSVPGGGANDNGAISSQVQYRGLSGPRMNVRIGGRPVESGGPNWMDPPLHYVPAGLLGDLEVERGIAPVSMGTGIGGAADVRYKQAEFSGGADWQVSGDFEATLRSVDESASVGGIFGVANDTHRLYASASRDEGNDFDFGSGTVDATEYERDSWGLAYGFTTGPHRLDVEYRRLDTDNSGTPSLPLDIAFLETDLWSGTYVLTTETLELELNAFGSDIDHGMDNFTLRPPPDFSSIPLPPFTGPDRRRVDAEADAWGFDARLRMGLGGGQLAVGFDLGSGEHDAVVTDPDFAPFFVDNFNHAEGDRYGGFVEWVGNVAADWTLEAGARLDRVENDAGDVDAFPAQLVDMNPGLWPPGTPPRAVWLLRERFNAADRDVNETLWDWVVEGRYTATESVTLEVGLARKSRAPSYLERYLWIPLEINAGLGDGNNYVGDVRLDPEVSHQLEVGLDWRGERGYASPRAYYRRVDDFIQGLPSTDPVVIAVSANANGDPTPMQFSNVDAELWGTDLAFGWRIDDSLRFDGVASYVRGKRRDAGDDLYRIAPPQLRLSLTWERATLSATVEQVLVAEQDKLSRTLTDDPGNPRNSFEETDAYGLTNVYGRWQANGALSVDVGVENLWDNSYIDHLTGFNRVMGSDADLGRRLPGRGVNGFARVRYVW